MAMQRINFYQATFHPVRVMLPLRQMLKILLVATLAIAFVSVYESFALRALRAGINDLEDIKQRQTQALQDLGAQVEAHRVRPQLEAQAGLLERTIDAKRRLLATVKAGPATQKARYSAVLEGLLRQAPAQLRVTDISIGESGRQVMINGFAASPDLLPQYVTQLRTSDALQGLPFSAIDMSRAGEERMHFRLSSREEEAHAKP